MVTNHTTRDGKLNHVKDAHPEDRNRHFSRHTRRRRHQNAQYLRNKKNNDDNLFTKVAKKRKKERRNMNQECQNIYLFSYKLHIQNHAYAVKIHIQYILNAFYHYSYKHYSYSEETLGADH